MTFEELLEDFQLRMAEYLDETDVFFMGVVAKQQRNRIQEVLDGEPVDPWRYVAMMIRERTKNKRAQDLISRYTSKRSYMEYL